MAALQGGAVALVLEALGSDQTLDLGCLGVWLRALLLRLDLTADNELANLHRSSDSTLTKDWRRSYEKTHIIFLAETEETTELGSTLGTETLGVNDIGHAGNVRVALLDDGESEDSEIHGDNATTDTLPLALSSSAGTVAGVADREEEPDTGRVHDTLLHRETLLVVATGDSEDVALELVADAVAGDFVTHTAVHEDAELALIFDLDQFLRAIVGVGDVELHLDAVSSRCAGCCNVSVVVEGRCLTLNTINFAWAES
jgi:hypothetical protein